MRTPHAVALSIVLLVNACGPGEREEAPDGPPRETRSAGATAPGDADADLPEDPLGALEGCPSGDAAWSRAIRHALRRRELPQLGERADRLAAACPGRWEPVWTSAECRFRSGETEPALGRALEALALARRGDDPVGVALAAYRAGWIRHRASAIAEGEALYREAIAAAGRASRPELEAQPLNGLAGLLLATGRLGEAQRRFREAADSLAELGFADQAGRLSVNRAVVLMLLGDVLSARELLEDAYERARGSGDAYLLPRVTLTLGNLERRLGRFEAARGWYARVPGEPRELAALAEIGLGRIAIAEGDFVEARARLDGARAGAYPGDRLIADAHRAEVELRAGNTARALSRLRRVIAEADATRTTEASWTARWLAGLGRLATGERELAVARLREAVTVIEETGDSLDPLADGMRFLRERAEPYADLAAALCGDGIDDASDPAAEELLEVVERTHARALRHAAGGAAAPEPARLGDLLAGLADDELLLDYAIGSERGVVLAIGRGRFHARPVPGWNRLGPPLDRFRAALVRPLRSAEARLDPAGDLRRSLPDGLALSEALLGPVLPWVERSRRTFVIPDGALALVPPAALPWPGGGSTEAPGWLGQRVDSAVLPMAGLPGPRRPPAAPVLLAGDPLPDAGGQVPPLPRAAEELRRIRQLWRGEPLDVLRGAELRPERLAALPLAEYGTIHLATHAVASTSDPARCAVYLSGGTRMGLDEIASLSLDGPLVTLSACRTAEGELVPGEGLLGLGWAFLRAGAGDVAASLWSVEDSAAMELMVVFHRRLRAGDDAVRAMSEARRAVAAQRPHPAYWAPFIVLRRPAPPGPGI